MTTTATDQVRLMRVFAYGTPARVLGPDASIPGFTSVLVAVLFLGRSQGVLEALDALFESHARQSLTSSRKRSSRLASTGSQA